MVSGCAVVVVVDMSDIKPNAQERMDWVSSKERERRASKYMFYCFCAITLMVGLGVTLCTLTP